MCETKKITITSSSETSNKEQISVISYLQAQSSISFIGTSDIPFGECHVQEAHASVLSTGNLSSDITETKCLVSEYTRSKVTSFTDQSELVYIDKGISSIYASSDICCGLSRDPNKHDLKVICLGHTDTVSLIPEIVVQENKKKLELDAGTILMVSFSEINRDYHAGEIILCELGDAFSVTFNGSSFEKDMLLPQGKYRFLSGVKRNSKIALAMFIE